MKAKRQELNVDEWVRNEWAQGNKNMLADMLTAANFNKDCARSETMPFWNCTLRFVAACSGPSVHKPLLGGMAEPAYGGCKKQAEDRTLH